MKDALTIHRALLGWETPHEIVRLPLAMTRADELPRALGLPPERCLVTRVYSCEDAHRGRPFLAGAIVPAGRRPSTEAVRLGVGARGVRPAHADVVNAVTEYAAGLVCPLLLPESMPLLIDRGLVDGLHAHGVVYTATGEASTALGIKASALYSLCRPKPVDLLAPLSAAPTPGRDHVTT
ncbi:hypothetical protein GCM10010402_13640 [Actinomadura luteofluorescens]|uniref:aminoacyl-tRNA deacylase n=1 Tax=Actinomadura luteofluorescens TaxID=46163 RepID=UPI002164D547|nr:YbaK/EbsC family protein [Actinomadura glauciflava]MCR3739747.1 Cys-tRNA(Pro) deacylase, prolyl-tRNA editing enzyme YbaK/EbsC [Actinomadura glauciflava]